MAKTETEIKKEIKDYIDGFGVAYSAWYVGIAVDPKDRLFNDHSVKKEDAWIYRTVSSSDAARRIEQYFVDVLDTDGGAGGGDENTKAVYAYKKNLHTDP